MLILYYRPTCPFCRKVVETGEELGIEFDLRDVNDPLLADEAVTIGGKRQFPFLVDEERGVFMYESADIVAYLHEQFSANQ